jgi:hypothetical protein
VFELVGGSFVDVEGDAAPVGGPGRTRLSETGVLAADDETIVAAVAADGADLGASVGQAVVVGDQGPVR